MTTFIVSLMANVPISATVSVTADNEQDAVAQATKLQSQAQLQWKYNGLPISTFRGPVSAIWASPPLLGTKAGVKKVAVILAVSIINIPFGTPASASATISPGAIGPVKFFSDTILLGIAVPNAAGVATLSNFNLPVGIHEVVAQFEGDTNFAPTASNKVRVNVIPPITSSVLIVSPNPAVHGTEVGLGVTVTSSAGTPTGLVIFYDGNTQIGSAVLVSGACIFNTSNLSIGSHQIKGVYQGTTDFASSTSNMITAVIT